VSSRITDVDVVTDLMIHDIDLALYLNGPVDNVHAYGTLDNGHISYTTAILSHQNGRFSKLTASRITEKRIRQINVTCRDMFIDCDLLKKELLVTKQTVDQSYRGVFLSSVEETIEVSNQEALLSEDMTFIQCAASGDFCNGIVPTVNDGLAAMTVAEKVQQSVWGGRQ
jgi:predicted dehydrogenase